MYSPASPVTLVVGTNASASASVQTLWVEDSATPTDAYLGLGSPRVTFVTSSASLPTGVTLDANTGQLVGVPAASSASASPPQPYVVQVYAVSAATDVTGVRLLSLLEIYVRGAPEGPSYGDANTVQFTVGVSGSAPSGAASLTIAAGYPAAVSPLSPFLAVSVSWVDGAGTAHSVLGSDFFDLSSSATRGLSFNGSNGQVSGTPLSKAYISRVGFNSTRYTVTVAAQNEVGRSEATTTLTVEVFDARHPTVSMVSADDEANSNTAALETPAATAATSWVQALLPRVTVSFGVGVGMAVESGSEESGDKTA